MSENRKKSKLCAISALSEAGQISWNSEKADRTMLSRQVVANQIAGKLVSFLQTYFSKDLVAQLQVFS